jgi:hypothetical protein
MPQPTATLSGTTQNGLAMERGIFNDKNRIGMVTLQADPYAKRVPEYYVGIFNVSKTELRVPRPFGKAGRTTQGDSAREVVIPGREGDDLYGKPFILRDIEPILRSMAGSDEITYVPTSGELLAQDVCNTNDPKGNWRTYRALNPATATNEGNNYYERGIFWCRLATPTSEPDMEAVEFAMGRLEAYYQRLIEEARQLWSGDPKDRKYISRPHHDAAEYFQIEDEPWHTTMRSPLRAKLAEKKAAAKKAHKDKSEI